MINDDLLELAQQEDIDVIFADFPSSGSVSTMSRSGRCYIGMDRHFETSAEARVHLGHELGHCVNAEFYNVYAPLDVRQKHENRADRWAMRQLVPPELLNDALHSGVTETWDLAEYFDVTEAFIIKTIKYYADNQLLALEDVC